VAKSRVKMTQTDSKRESKRTIGKQQIANHNESKKRFEIKMQNLNRETGSETESLITKFTKI